MMHNNMGWNGMGGMVGFPAVSGWFVLVVIFAVAIKGYALWHAARRNEPWWFFFLLVINTFGILELVYLIFVAKVLPPSRRSHHAHTDTASQ